MSDLVILYLVLFALYVTECFAWVPRDILCFVSLRDRIYRAVEGHELFGNERGGILAVSVLPFLGSAFICRVPRTSPLPDGERVGRAKRRVHLWRLAVAPLRLVCSFLFLFVFVYCPVLIWIRGLASTWLFLSGILVGLVAVVELQFRWSHKRLFPDAREERRSRLLLMTFSPLAAMRAADTLTRPLLEQVHPLTTALALCSPADATAVARKWLVDSGLAAEADWGARSSAALSPAARAADALLGQVKLSIAGVLSPPPAEHEGCRSYCPRCASQYLLRGGWCSSCGSVALRPFGARAPRS
jgi:hypothetical protein